jgi:hypothetical protein
MKAVTRGELLGLEEYEAIRERFRARVIQDKSVRRVALGANMTVLFENHDTVLFQIQEMLRTERITKESAIAHEIETYNALVPGDAELCATVFLEYVDADERERMLQKLAGIEECFALSVDGDTFPATGEQRGARTDRTTAVQYVKFPLSSVAVSVLKEGREQKVAVAVRHEHYAAEAVLSAATLASLREDFD